MKELRERIWTLRWPLMVGFITAVGLALRIWKAWTMRYPAANGDFSVQALMAKHMAEGVDFPFFAYGVAYMGSLEPAISALIAVIFRTEVSPFIMNLSPAIVGTLLLPLVYLLGRDAGSRRAGLLAMIYCLVGSDTLFHNSVAPRGGYMNMMVGGMVALWLACRIATRERNGEHVPWLIYFWMGLAAGVAFWVTQLVIVFLLAACTVLLIGFRIRMLRVGLLPAISGFLLGSCPWWIWNITHTWGSLDFGESIGRVPFSHGLLNFIGMFLKVTEMGPVRTWINAPRFILLAGMMICFTWILLCDKFYAKNNDLFFFRLAAPLLIIFMILIFCTSQYSRLNASRYLLPVIPAVAIMVGVTCDWILNRIRLPIGWIALLMVIPTHIFLLSRMNDAVPEERARWELAARIEKEVASFCDGNFVGDLFRFHWLNFASKERLCVASLPLERYAPYARRVELAERRAYFSDFGRLTSFLYRTGGSSCKTNIDNLLVDYNITPPPNDWDYLDTNCITAARDHKEEIDRNILLDSVMDTSWQTILQPGSSNELMFTFNQSVPLCGIRLLSLHGEYPCYLAIEGRQSSSSSWQTLLFPGEFSTYFWSGRYAMIDGVQFFYEFRFAAPAGGLSEIRITFHGPKEGAEPVCISEVIFMKQAQPPSQEIPSVTDCIAVLKEKGLKKYYAPRWLAERISGTASNNLVTLLPSLFKREIDECASSDPITPNPIQFTEDTGLIMDARDAPRSRNVLRTAGLEWQETPLGGLVMLKVSKDNGSPAGKRFFPLYWTEQGCFSPNDMKEKAHELFASVVMNANVDDQKPKVEALRETLRLYPQHQPARQALIAALKAAGQNDEASTNAVLLKTFTQPDHPGRARFKNGVELLGINLNPEIAKPGQTIDITYFWKSPSFLDTKKLAAFVHIKAGENRFQDDHVFLHNVLAENIIYQPFEEVFTESRRLIIPPSTPPGNYRFYIGLVDRVNHKRQPIIQTDLPETKKALELPVTLKIAP